MVSLWSEESAKTLCRTGLMAYVEKHWELIHLHKVIMLLLHVILLFNYLCIF
jgi:hypothetical protein